ncbi:MAG TPA: hypothetical protein VGR91_11955 [Stellaceae bacterium]|nr:hypothetical protein [Stellaceae bacterium]
MVEPIATSDEDRAVTEADKEFSNWVEGCNDWCDEPSQTPKLQAEAYLDRTAGAADRQGIATTGPYSVSLCSREAAKVSKMGCKPDIASFETALRASSG